MITYDLLSFLLQLNTYCTDEITRRKVFIHILGIHCTIIQWSQKSEYLLLEPCKNNAVLIRVLLTHLKVCNTPEGAHKNIQNEHLTNIFPAFFKMNSDHKGLLLITSD